MRFYDAHCHLQDKRLKPFLSGILTSLPRAGIASVSVCGSRVEDWQEVKGLAGNYDWIIPSYGVHPWYVKRLSDNWFETFLEFVNGKNCGVGEIGLDAWIKWHDLELQETVFVRQLRVAAEKNLPVSIHCVKAWELLLKILKNNPLPQCGFLLHSYGGLKEFIKPLAELGAYFSFPGYFAKDSKKSQLESFREIPLDRLLIETDAPDQLPPDYLNRYNIVDRETLRPLNHPLNLIPIYEFLARYLNMPLEDLYIVVEQNYLRLFGRLMRKKTAIL
jgi:TatD DNase family protein